ncbi:MAG: 3-oxoacyl-ACP reductase family protein [Nanoarchaeota archaeon]|nr:3-oxoacyl-ACP reductase family protein [Nanoarchaeota archaeon]
MKLQGKVALITGASRGIGASIALTFAQEGAVIALNYNNSERFARAMVRDIQIYTQATSYRADMSNLEQVRTMVDKVISDYGRLDILVNNAGILHRNSFFESTEDIWDETMNLNLKAVYFCSQYATQHMTEGSIINISSLSGQKPGKKDIEYGLSKCGVEFITCALAKALAPNIRVNAIAPGRTYTDMTGYRTNPAKEAKRIKEIPLKRINEPEDIANLAVFLASEQARQITGQIINVDGGSGI